MFKLYLLYIKYYNGKNVEQNPVIPKQNSGAKQKCYNYITSVNCFTLLYFFVLKKHDNMQLVLPA